MDDDFMDYILLLDDDEEDKPKLGEKSGCGFLLFVLFCIAALALIYLICH